MLRSHFDYLMGRIVEQHPKCSDIIFTAQKPIQAEVYGVLQSVSIPNELEALTPFHTDAMAMVLLEKRPKMYRDLLATGSCDLSYALPGVSRFRVNIFSQQGSTAIVMRRLSTQIPGMKELGLPPVFQSIAKEHYGLVLVTGSTGSGKSTSLACLVDMINSSSAKHIITLEDPIEYHHPHKTGTVNQRELGLDFDSYASGLRAALRQAPKVILVGEMRDRETTQIALEASETGHLVLGTLHSGDAGQTINRIVGMFDLSEERLIRSRLAENLKYVVSQRLAPTIKGGRVAAFEVLCTSLRIRELIVNGEKEEKTFAKVIESSSPQGMFTFDQSVVRLYVSGTISEQTAMAYCSDRSRVHQVLNRLKAEQGQEVSAIKNLEIDTDYDMGIM